MKEEIPKTIGIEEKQKKRKTNREEIKRIEKRKNRIPKAIGIENKTKRIDIKNKEKEKRKNNNVIDK